MKKVFVCSPLRGEYEKNFKKAVGYSRKIALGGKIPITPHIYFTQFLNDKSKKERDLGIKMGCELLKLCDEIAVFGKPTSGMKKEINLWLMLNKK
jgi:hypothetical protein